MRKTVTFVALVAVALSLVSCGDIAKKVASKAGKNAAKEAIEKTSKKTAGVASKKVVTEFGSEAVEKAAKGTISKSMRELATSNSAIRSLYDNFTSRISKEFADGIVVNSTEKGVEMVSRDFPFSSIRMNKNLMIGKAGSLKDAGPMNEFLNHLLPNKKYIVDECFIYDTDALGRVGEAVADRTKAYKSIQRNTQRNSDLQRYIVENLDGRVGLDDGGHLFANNTGGPNELINQIPMSRELNQHGKWREMERLEERALKEGKQVISKRKMLYKGSEKRPYAIEFTSIIDGVETSVVIDNI